VHELQGKAELAIADFRKALSLQANASLEQAQQADATKRVAQLSRRVGCGVAGNAIEGELCL
jgi:hypothetical protein